MHIGGPGEAAIDDDSRSGVLRLRDGHSLRTEGMMETLRKEEREDFIGKGRKRSDGKVIPCRNLDFV